MTYKMAKSESLLIKYFLPYLESLCYDSVPNVRISMATVLREIYNSKIALSNLINLIYLTYLI